MPILVDSNVLVYFWDEHSVFHKWAEDSLVEHGESDILAVNPIIYAELCLAVDAEAALDERLTAASFEKFDLPWPCLFRAAMAFARHARARKGVPPKPAKTPLPDFFIGAHAQTLGYSVMTVDARRFRTYFPRLTVIAPG